MLPQHTTSGSPDSFELGDVIERARGLIAGSKRFAAYLLLTFLGITFGVAFLSTFMFALDPNDLRLGPWWWELMVAAFTSGVLAMMTVAFGLYRITGARLTYRSLFDFMGTLWPFLIVTFPVAYLSLAADGSGSRLLVLAVGVAVYPTAFTPYFMVDRRLGPLAAVGRAYSLVLTNVGSFVLLTLLFVALTILCVLTLGLGLIWVAPFMMLANAVIYDEAVGVAGTFAG